MELQWLATFLALHGWRFGVEVELARALVGGRGAIMLVGASTFARAT
jgi:hypothetical protein